MKFLFKKYPAKKGEVIEVSPSASAVVKFMTAKEFKNYAGGRTHTYYKGQQDAGAVRFSLPFDSVWHAVVEKTDDSLRATSKLKAAPPADHWIDAPAPEGTHEAEAEAEHQAPGPDSASEEPQ